MIRTFGLFDLDVKEHVLDLINKRASFKVRMVTDDEGNPHHWEIES